VTDFHEAPYVCPGCYAVASPCLPGCIDAEIELEAEEDRGRRYPCSACGETDCEYTWADECPGRHLADLVSPQARSKEGT
jgi:hypothetical protein